MPLSRIAPYWAGLGVTQIVVMFDAPRHCSCRTEHISLINLAAANRRRGEVWLKLVTAVIIKVHCR